MEKATIQSICFLLTLMAFVGCTMKTGKVSPADLEKDKAAIERLIGQYVDTINSCDTALVNAIWSHDAKVSFIGPNTSKKSGGLSL